MPFLLVLSSKWRTCKKTRTKLVHILQILLENQEFNGISSNKTSLVFLVLFSVPVFCPHFFQYPEVYDQFYYRHELTTFFWVTTNICVFRIARILVLTGEFWVPSSSAIRRRLQTSVVGKFPEKSMHFLSPTPPLYRSAFF